MIECVRFKSYVKGCLQGFATLYIEKWGIEIHGCSLNMKEGKRWISFPSKEVNENGVKKYIPYLHFRDKLLKEKFSELAIRAIEKFCSEQPKEKETAFIEEGDLGF